MRIDLHTHSSVSDGTEDPATLMETARRAGLDVVALTDHDTTDGWGIAERSRPRGLTVVPGMELSCRWFPRRRPADQRAPPGLLFDPTHPGLAAERERLRVERLSRPSGSSERWSTAAIRWCGRTSRPGAPAGSSAARTSPAPGGRRSRRVRGPRVRHAPEPPQPLLRGQGRHRGQRGDRVGPGGRRGSGLRPRDGDHARPDGRRRRDRHHGRRGAARDRGRPPRPLTGRARAPARPAADLGLLVTGSSDYHGTNKQTGIGANTTDPAQLERLLDAGIGSEPFRD